MHEDLLIFHVTTGALSLESLDQDRHGGHNAPQFLQRVVDRLPEIFEGKRGFMAYGEYPPDPHKMGEFDIGFSSTKILGEESPYYEMPCSTPLKWPLGGAFNMASTMESFPEKIKAWSDPKAFWMGMDTHPSCRALSEIAKRIPDKVDVRPLVWNRGECDLLSNLQTDSVTPPSHSNYQYLIDCPGPGNSGKLCWLLSLGRPVFVVAREVVEHWHEKLVPWIHYVPIRSDLTDFEEALSFLDSNPALSIAIGKAAARFAQDELTFDRQVDRCVNMINPPNPPGGNLSRYETLVENVIEASQLLGVPGIILEIGAFRGGGTAKLAKHLMEQGSDKTLLVVDTFNSGEDDTCNTNGVSMSEIYRHLTSGGDDYRSDFIANTFGFRNVKVFRGRSDEIIIAKADIAFAFIDGGHASDDVRNDFNLVWPRLSSGGVIAFHDYGGDLPMVTRTINECMATVEEEIKTVRHFAADWIIAITKR